jgi:hypothetical protein
MLSGCALRADNQEVAMHPAITSALAAERRRDMMTQAAAVRRARQARRARRARRAAAAPGSHAGLRRPQPCPDLVIRQA